MGNPAPPELKKEDKIMELKILEKVEAKKSPVYLKLEKVKGVIAVVACNKSGERFMNDYVVYFTTDGEFVRYPNVNPKLGFSLDEEGRIIEEVK